MVTAGTVAPDLRAFPDDNARFIATVKQGKNNMPPWKRHSERSGDHRDLGLRIEPEEAMKRRLVAVAAALLATATAVRAAEDPLKVCLDENLPPLSMHQRGKPDSGFDVALAQAVAERLGRPLKIQWFESKLDESSSPALEANALLSDGRCALVGSYVFTKDSLVVPGVKTAKLPDFEGATRDDRRRRVPVGVLAPSQPYVYSPLTVVLGEKARGRKISGVGDLAGLRIAIESGTLGDAILMTFEKGRLDRQTSRIWFRGGTTCSVRSIAATSTRHCSTCAASMPIAPPIPIPSSPHPDTIIRSASIGAMSASPAIRRSSSRSTRRSPICRRQEPSPNSPRRPASPICRP